MGSLAVDSTSYADARSKGLEMPTSGLMTQWTLINVPRAVSYTGRATAIEARTSAGGVPGYGNIVLFPQTRDFVSDPLRTLAVTTDPSFSGGSGSNGDSVPSPRTNPLAYSQHLMPDLSTPYLPSGLNGSLGLGAAPRLQAYAISKALATTSIGGELVTEPSILAKTDWVVTFPTRYLEVGQSSDTMSLPGVILVTDFRVDDSGAAIGNGVKNFFVIGSNLKPEPFIQPSCVIGIDPYSSGTPVAAKPQTETNFRTRGGAALVLQPPTSGGTASSFELCGHSGVLRFTRPGADVADGVLGDVRNRWQMISNSTAGWGRIQIPGVANQGLPIIGFAVSELYNGAVAPGTAGVFGLTFPLSTTRP